MNREYTITKRQGAVLDSAAVHRWLDDVLSTMPNGVRTLSLRRPNERRSNVQNRLMWLWLTCIADETGQDRQTVHDYYCTRFLVRNTEFNGRPVQVVIGTSGLDRETMTWFLNQVQADAASELGIRLPSPDDEAWAAFDEYYRGRL